jgi:hypothetical protein
MKTGDGRMQIQPPMGTNIWIRFLNTDEHLLALINHEHGFDPFLTADERRFTLIRTNYQFLTTNYQMLSTNRLMKNCAASAAHAVWRVGRRVAPESTAAALSDRNDGPAKFFSSPPISASIRVHPRLKKY